MWKVRSIDNKKKKLIMKWYDKSSWLKGIVIMNVICFIVFIVLLIAFYDPDDDCSSGSNNSKESRSHKSRSKGKTSFFGDYEDYNFEEEELEEDDYFFDDDKE